MKTFSIQQDSCPFLGDFYNDNAELGFGSVQFLEYGLTDYFVTAAVPRHAYLPTEVLAIAELQDVILVDVRDSQGGRAISCFFLRY